MNAAHSGSLTVVQSTTRSPNRSATSAVYSANREAVSRDTQPPSCCSCDGRSQWYRVRNGVMPAASRSSTIRS